MQNNKITGREQLSEKIIGKFDRLNGYCIQLLPAQKHNCKVCPGGIKKRTAPVDWWLELFMSRIVDATLVKCFEHARASIAEIAPAQGRPYEARAAIALFWEVCKSGRVNLDAINYPTFVEAHLQNEFWKNPSEFNELIQYALTKLATGSSITAEEYLLYCSALCRYLDDKLVSNEIEWMNEDFGQQAENIVTVNLQTGSQFSMAGRSSGDFEIHPKLGNWPNSQIKIQQRKLPYHSIRNHTVVPYSIGQQIIQIVRNDLPQRAKLLFLSPKNKEKIKVTAHMHAFKGSRTFPRDANEELLDFFSGYGINEKTRATECLDKVEVSCKEGANIIVFPELTSSEASVELLRESLSEVKVDSIGPSLVLAGSAHLICENGFKRNRATLLYEDGSVAMHQDKLNPYFEVPKDQEHVFREDIRSGETINLLPTVIGLVSIQICKDFCDALASYGSDITEILEVGLILVPSMGSNNTISAHRREIVAKAKLNAPLVALSQQNDGVASSENFLAWRDASGGFSDDPHPSPPGHLYKTDRDCRICKILLET